MFSTNLMRLMDERGWTAPHLMAALADQGIEISQQSVDRWIDGSRNPRAEYIPAIAHALGVTPNDLFGIEPALAANE